MTELKASTKWLSLISLAIGFIMATLDASIMNVAVATIQTKMAITNSSGAWIIDAYLLSFASLLLLGGSLANKFGSNQIYIVGLLIFTIGSIAGGGSQNSDMLISARFIQGIGAALFMPSSLSLLVLSFTDAKERAKMLGIWTAVVSISSGIGPFIGGLLIDSLGWRSIFYINVPFGILGIFMAYRFVIKPKGNHSLSLNFLANLISIILLAAFSYVLIEGGVIGWTKSDVLIALFIFLISLILLVLSEKRSRLPLIPLDLLKNRRFVFSNITAVALNIAMFGGLFMFGLFLQKTKGDSALVAGAEMIPMMIVFMFGNILFARLVKKFSVHSLLLTGLSIAVLGTIALPFLLNLPYVCYALVYAIANLGVGMVVPALTAVTMQSAGDTNSNIASSVFQVARQIGSLIGVALMGILFYQSSTPVLGAQITFVVMTLCYGLGIVMSFERRKR